MAALLYREPANIRLERVAVAAVVNTPGHAAEFVACCVAAGAVIEIC
jgi:hypothetical protein